MPPHRSPEGLVKAAIFAELRTKPGASVGAIARKLGVDHSTVSYHLRRFEREGLASSHPVGRIRAYYPSGSGFCPLQRALLPRLPSASRIALVRLSSQGKIRYPDLVEENLRAGSVRWGVERLVDAGIVRRVTPGLFELTEAFRECAQPLGEGTPCRRWGFCPPSLTWDSLKPSLERSSKGPLVGDRTSGRPPSP